MHKLNAVYPHRTCGTITPAEPKTYKLSIGGTFDWQHLKGAALTKALTAFYQEHAPKAYRDEFGLQGIMNFLTRLDDKVFKDAGFDVFLRTTLGKQLPRDLKQTDGDVGLAGAHLLEIAKFVARQGGRKSVVSDVGKRFNVRVAERVWPPLPCGTRVISHHHAAQTLPPERVPTDVWGNPCSYDGNPNDRGHY